MGTFSATRDTANSDDASQVGEVRNDAAKNWAIGLICLNVVIAIACVTLITDTGPYHWWVCLDIGAIALALAVRARSLGLAIAAGVSAVLPIIMVVITVSIWGFV